MITMMTSRVYRSVCVHAGDARRGYLLRPFPLESVLKLPYPVAIYIVTDYLDEVDYVGSTCRPEDRRGLERRIGEHVRHPEREFAWRKLWIIPLKAETPAVSVRSIEGAVGRHLKPKNNHRLPRVA